MYETLIDKKLRTSFSFEYNQIFVANPEEFTIQNTDSRACISLNSFKTHGRLLFLQSNMCTPNEKAQTYLSQHLGFRI